MKTKTEEELEHSGGRQDYFPAPVPFRDVTPPKTLRFGYYLNGVFMCSFRNSDPRPNCTSLCTSAYRVFFLLRHECMFEVSRRGIQVSGQLIGPHIRSPQECSHSPRRWAAANTDHEQDCSCDRDYDQDDRDIGLGLEN